MGRELLQIQTSGRKTNQTETRSVCVCAFLAVCASAYLINDVTETRSKGAEGERRERQTVLPNVQPSDQALKEELFNFKFPLI